MPEINVTLGDHEDAQFGELIIGACARQLLTRYLSDDEGSAYAHPTELQRRIQDEVLNVIREEARAAAPGIAEKILAGEVPQSDGYGYASGRSKSIAEVIADEVKGQLRHGSGRQGESVLDKLIREEVQRQLRTELKDVLDAAKREVAEALGKEAREALTGAIQRALPEAKL